MEALLLLLPPNADPGPRAKGDFRMDADRPPVARATGGEDHVYIGAQILNTGPASRHSRRRLFAEPALGPDDRRRDARLACSIPATGAMSGHPEGIAEAERLLSRCRTCLRPRPQLFALPPGVDFPAELVAGLLARMAGQPPEAMARVTLDREHPAHAPSRDANACRPTGRLLLPRILLVTEAGPLANLPLAGDLAPAPQAGTVAFCSTAAGAGSHAFPPRGPV